MDLAIELASNDKKRREETKQGMKFFYSQPLLTQAKRAEDFVAIIFIETNFIEF